MPTSGGHAGATFVFQTGDIAASPDGRIAWTARVNDPAHPGTPYNAVYVRGPLGSTLHLDPRVALPGIPAGAITSSIPRVVGVNTAGEIRFNQDVLNPACTSCPRKDVFFADATGVHPIWIQGAPAPVGTPPVFTTIRIGSPAALNSRSQAVLSANVQATGQTALHALFGWTSTHGLFYIIGPGTQVEISPGQFRTVGDVFIAGIDPISSGELSSALNDDGDFAFRLRFTDNSTGVFLGQFGDFLVGQLREPAITQQPIATTVSVGAPAAEIE